MCPKGLKGPGTKIATNPHLARAGQTRGRQKIEIKSKASETTRSFFSAPKISPGFENLFEINIFLCLSRENLGTVGSKKGTISCKISREIRLANLSLAKKLTLSLEGILFGFRSHCSVTIFYLFHIYLLRTFAYCRTNRFYISPFLSTWIIINSRRSYANSWSHRDGF